MFSFSITIYRKQLTFPLLTATSLPKSSHSSNLCKSVTLRILFTSETDMLSLRNLVLSSLWSVPSTIIWNITDWWSNNIESLHFQFFRTKNSKPNIVIGFDCDGFTDSLQSISWSWHMKAIKSQFPKGFLRKASKNNIEIYSYCHHQNNFLFPEIVFRRTLKIRYELSELK